MAAEENDLRVLIVEDDPMTAEAHADFVRRIPGFTVAGISLGGTAALERFDALTAEGRPVDLVLPRHEPRRRPRAGGGEADDESEHRGRHHRDHRGAASAGDPLGDRGGDHAVPHQTVRVRRVPGEAREPAGVPAGSERGGELATQESVDSALSALRSVAPGRLPKGLIEETLETVSAAVREAPAPVSATEVGRALDLSRVTVRRYLEHLVTTRQAVKRPARHPGPPRVRVPLGVGAREEDAAAAAGHRRRVTACPSLQGAQPRQGSGVSWTAASRSSRNRVAHRQRL